jgi:hypothetical protein
MDRKEVWKGAEMGIGTGQDGTYSERIRREREMDRKEVWKGAEMGNGTGQDGT